jgi:SNF family Na+-dependent transporter
MRSVHPQFAGVGLAASYAGYITCCLYTYLLALCLMFANKAGDQAPWREQYLNRPLACQTANKYQSNPAQLYFYMNATTLNDINTCEPWSAAKAGTMDSRSNDEIKVWLAVTWSVIMIGVVMGPRSIGPFTAITTPLKWILLFACLGMYVTLQGNQPARTSDGWKANGAGLYWGGVQWNNSDGSPLNVGTNLASLYKDCYNQVFFSLGTCVGVFFAYGRYREVNAKVITPAFVIAFADFMFSILSGFVVWAGLAILVVRGDASRFQTSSTGLTFIAFPRLADQTNSMTQFQVFMIFLWISGIDSAISYMQGWLQNSQDSNPKPPAF